MNLPRISFFAALLAVLLASHLAYSGALWEGDVLPGAAALQMTRGAVLYRDVWFDKPPLVPAIYLLWGAKIGAPLRIAGALYAWLVCLLAYAFAAIAWTRREGFWAAGLMAFFLTFDTHSGVIPLAADMLLVAPQLAALWLVHRKQPLASGIAAGIGFLFNAKAVFVLAAAALFAWPAIIPLAAGFAIPNAVALAWLAAHGAFGPYIDQVWHWSSLYAASPVVGNPVREGIVRTANWFGFHAALLIGAALLWRKRPKWRYAAWAVIAMAGVTAGWRFFPRYYLLLLPPLVLAAARALADAKPRWIATLALLTMLVPLIRFGPRYLSASTSPDLAMDRDSRQSAQLALAQHGHSLYVWGYRPELYLYTNLPPASRWLDSQALTGVPADRHLTQTRPIVTESAAQARAELARTQPDVIVDGLSLYNPALSMDRYPELRPWIAQYREAGRTQGTVVYVKR